jgi:hypothetical protein
LRAPNTCASREGWSQQKKIAIRVYPSVALRFNIYNSHDSDSVS